MSQEGSSRQSPRDAAGNAKDGWKIASAPLWPRHHAVRTKLELAERSARHLAHQLDGHLKDIERLEAELARLEAAPGPADASEAAIEVILTGKKEKLERIATLLAASAAATNPERRPIHQVARSTLRRLIGPRLGLMYQYPSRPMRLPPAYRATRLTAGEWPSIAIVTPSYGHGRFISDTLQSVVGQDYPALRYFVQDGGSQDETADILSQWSSHLAGWQSAADNGQSHALNLGFSRVSGEIMAYLNSDDLLLPGALACVADFFVAHPEVDVVYGNRLLIDEDGNEIGRWVLPGHDDRALRFADYIPQETLFWRRAIWERAGGRIDETFRFAMDWDLLMRFRQAGARFAHIPRFLGAFRIHLAQKTSAEIQGVGLAEMNRIRRREFGRVPSMQEIRRAVTPFMIRHMLADARVAALRRLRLA